MRGIPLLLYGIALGACSTTVEQPMRSAEAQADYQRMIEGKVAQPPITCLPSYNANDMHVIDDSTVAFRLSSNRVYIGHLLGGCSNLGRSGYAMLTRQFGSSGLCHGDIAQVVDTLSGMTVGSCVIGGFTPYVRP